MQETEFHQLVDAMYDHVEEVIDTLEVDIDCQITGTVLTLTVEENNSKIILSRQPSQLEIWVAARSGGFHFSFSDGLWRCFTSEHLAALLGRVTKEQSGVQVNFDFSHLT